jgi:two-component system NtrC family sensor kinase
MPNLLPSATHVDASIHGEKYYRDLQRKNLLRLIVTYLAPMILLSAYFYFQYHAVFQESLGNHLRTVAESRASAMDLFLHERIVNLFNVFDDPKLAIPLMPGSLEPVLHRLRQASDAFEDLGFIEAAGVQSAYAGPYLNLRGRDYGREAWFLTLKTGTEKSVVTDIYAGFRGKPHFTLAVSRIIGGRYCTLRAALDPEKTCQILDRDAETADSDIVVVNRAGQIQLPLPAADAGIRQSSVPALVPRIGLAAAAAGGQKQTYAYAWLRTCPWAVLAMPAAGAGSGRWRDARVSIIALAAAVIAMIFAVIVIRSRHIVQHIRQADATRSQLTDNLIHTSKLAAVGELASGIAHEINNPLAVISEEVGLIQDLSDPRYGIEVSLQDMAPHLDAIHEAVVRCRGITGKLLAFVRKGEVTVQSHDLHQIIDDVVDNFYGRGIAGAGIKIIRSYCRDDLFVLADRNQLEQVFLNLINNAMDAIGRNGEISITTTMLWEYDRVRVEVADTGVGIPEEQLEKIFLPFYTTKKVGKGTGLGLSISYAIIRSMDGDISVASTLGKGSVFSILLPVVVPEGETKAEKEGTQEKEHATNDPASTRG